MLKNRVRLAVFWSAWDILIRQVFGFFVAVVLARLLAPEDFGVLALMALFLGLANLFVNAGFSSALIQRQDITDIDESTVFWFNIVVALVMTVAVMAISPWIAEFYTLPVLKPLAMLLALNIFVSALGTIHSTILTKKIDFKVPMIVGSSATIISGSLGVYMAWTGYGVWALAWQVIVSTSVSTALLWLLSPWRPTLVFRWASLKRLLGFSSWLFAANVLDTLYLRGYSVLIGRIYGFYELGIYDRAENTQMRSSGLLTGMLSRIVFPLFSNVSNDKERLRRAFRLSLRSVMLITAPTMIGLGVLAAPVIQLVFGEKWLPAAPILQVLCVVGFLWPFQIVNQNALQAQGYAALYFRVSVVKKITGILLLLLGSLFGIMGIAWSRVFQSIIALMINGYYSQKFLGYGIWEQNRDCVSSLILSAVMAIVVAMADQWIHVGGLTELFLIILLGASFYMSANVLIGADAYKDALSFFRARG